MMKLFGKTPKGSPPNFGGGDTEQGQQSSSFGRSQPAPRIEMKKPLSPQKPSTPPKPKTLFEEKKDWTRSDFLRKATKDSFGSGGKMRSSYEREKILKEALPVGRFGTYISEGEAKTKLRELRSKEYYAKGAEREKLKETRKNLEKGSGLAGKY